MTCPKCGTTQLPPRSFVITSVFGKPAIRREYRCFSCDCSFATLEVIAETVDRMRRERFRTLVDRIAADAKLANLGVLA